MSAKINQLKLLLSLEEKKLKEALLNYTKANQAYMAAHAQYEQLVAYQGEYASVLNKKNNMQAHTLSVYYGFIHKLDLAIKEQATKVQKTKERSAVLFQHYLLLKQKSDGLENLLEKEKILQQKKQVKQEQKQTDESAASQWLQEKP